VCRKSQHPSRLLTIRLLALRLPPDRQMPGPERPRCLACCRRAHRRGLCRLWLGDGSASAGDAREWPGRTCWRGCDHGYTGFPVHPTATATPVTDLPTCSAAQSNAPCLLARLVAVLSCTKHHCCLRHNCNTFSSHPLMALLLALDTTGSQRVICVHGAGCWCAVLVESAASVSALPQPGLSLLLG
jgi:hypothetical protein